MLDHQPKKDSPAAPREPGTSDVQIGDTFYPTADEYGPWEVTRGPIDVSGTLRWWMTRGRASRSWPEAQILDPAQFVQVRCL